MILRDTADPYWKQSFAMICIKKLDDRLESKKRDSQQIKQNHQASNRASSFLPLLFFFSRCAGRRLCLSIVYHLFRALFYFRSDLHILYLRTPVSSEKLLRNSVTMKYSFVAAFALGLVGYAKAAPAVPLALLPPRPYQNLPGSPLAVQPKCSSDGDCGEGHYCVTESGICSIQTREDTIAGDEEEAAATEGNEKRIVIPPPIVPPFPNPNPLPILPKCSSDGDCAEGHYCVTESGICSVQTREETIAGDKEEEAAAGNEKRYPPPEIVQGLENNGRAAEPMQKRATAYESCSTDADCEGDHYCITGTGCSAITREEASAQMEALPDVDESSDSEPWPWSGKLTFTGPLRT